MNIPCEIIPPLDTLPLVTHAFTLRTAADTRSDNFPHSLLAQFGYLHAVTADQPHGTGVALVTAASLHNPAPIANADALVTRATSLPLLVRCADCVAVFVVDRATPAIGLAHSGKAGTAGNIMGATLATMRESFGTNPADCLACLSPSIGPCHYEVDLWSAIEQQLRRAGVTDIQNPRRCTACHLDRYFSYRAERGHTGRMYALLALKPPPPARSTNP